MKKIKISIYLMSAILFIAAGQGFGFIAYQDNGTHNINYPITQDVGVYNATTVNLLTGGSVAQSLSASDNSKVIISGGSVGNLYTYISSQLTMHDGTVNGLYAYANSQVTMFGGSSFSLMSAGNSQIALSGGSVNYVYTYTSSQLTINGGQVSGWLYAYSSSNIAISDGLISGGLHGVESSHITMSGGTIAGVQLENYAILTLDGSNFSIDGSPVNFGEITSILGGSFENESVRRLTGILANGDIINNPFRIGDYAKIVLVPEPCSLVLLVIGGLALLKRRA